MISSSGDWLEVLATILRIHSVGLGGASGRTRTKETLGGDLIRREDGEFLIYLAMREWPPTDCPSCGGGG